MAMANGGDGRVRTRERERGRGKEESGEGERVQGGGGRGDVRAFQGDEEGARQAERLVAWRGGARACRARARPPVGEEDDRGGGRLVGWAAPVGCQHRSWAGGLRGERQVVPLLFPSLFYFLQFVFYLTATEFKFKQI